MRCFGTMSRSLASDAGARQTKRRPFRMWIKNEQKKK